MNDITGKILLRPAVPGKDNGEIYIVRTDNKSIVLHDHDHNTLLLDTDAEILPDWIINEEDPAGSLDAWTFDWDTPDNCLLLGVSLEVLKKAFKALELGVGIIVSLNHILRTRQKTPLISGQAADCLDTIRRQAVDDVWKELTRALAYDPYVAESRGDRMRLEQIAAMDKEINYLSEELSKCYIKRLRLVKGGRNACENEK